MFRALVAACMPFVIISCACVVPAGPTLLLLRSEASAGTLYWNASPDRIALTRSALILRIDVSCIGLRFGVWLRARALSEPAPIRHLGELGRMTAVLREEHLVICALLISLSRVRVLLLSCSRRRCHRKHNRRYLLLSSSSSSSSSWSSSLT